jgi:hypothetical protein
MNNGVDHAVLEHELRRDGPFGQLHVHKPFDHARTCEADEGTRLCQNHIA